MKKMRRPPLRSTSQYGEKINRRPPFREKDAARPPARRQLSKEERAERRRYRQENRPDHQLPRPTPKMQEDDPERIRVREEVLEAAGYRCQNCGSSKCRLTIDHIVPRHLGGGNHRENLQCLCLKCNQAKGLGIYAAPPPSKAAA